MTDEILDFDKLDPNKELTPENLDKELFYTWEILLDSVKVVLDWYYDPQPYWDALAEKLGKTAVKKIQEEIEARGAVAEAPPF